MANIELILNEAQKLEVQKIIKALNSKGSFITASVLDNILRATSSNRSDLVLLKTLIQKIT